MRNKKLGQLGIVYKGCYEEIDREVSYAEGVMIHQDKLADKNKVKHRRDAYSSNIERVFTNFVSSCE